MRSTTCRALTLMFSLCGTSMAVGSAASADDSVKIGVLGDMSGIYRDVSGPGAIEAVKMAVEDFGGTVLGRPILVLSADHQNKPDTAVAIARRWSTSTRSTS